MLPAPVAFLRFNDFVILFMALEIFWKLKISKSVVSVYIFYTWIIIIFRNNSF